MKPLIPIALLLTACAQEHPAPQESSAEKRPAEKCEHKDLTESECLDLRFCEMEKDSGRFDHPRYTSQADRRAESRDRSDRYFSCIARVNSRFHLRKFREKNCSDTECVVFTNTLKLENFRGVNRSLEPYTIEDGVQMFCDDTRTRKTNYLPSCRETGGNVYCGEPFIAGSCPEIEGD